MGLGFLKYLDEDVVDEFLRHHWAMGSVHKDRNQITVYKKSFHRVR